MPNLKTYKPNKPGTVTGWTPPYPGQDAVFNTYELLESIIVALPSEDIVRAASKVNKTWHAVVASSVAINKRIISSGGAVKHMRKNRFRLGASSFSYVRFSWGEVFIKRLETTEILFVVDTSFEPRPIPPVTAAEIEVLGLNDKDAAKLKNGWSTALASFYDLGWGDDDLLARLELRLYEVARPQEGKWPQIAYDVRMEREPEALAEAWRKGIRIPPAIYETGRAMSNIAAASEQMALEAGGIGR